VERPLAHCVDGFLAHGIIVGFFGILSKGCSSQGLRFLLWKAVEISQLSLGHFGDLPATDGGKYAVFTRFRRVWLKS
jgi:hypothetical protein